MSRQHRPTLPQTTLLGKIASYEDLEPQLVKAEINGRLWAYEKSTNQVSQRQYPIDQDIYELHRVMFQPIYQWAGQPRREARGPAGTEHIPWQQVRVTLRQRFQDLGAQYKHAIERYKGELPTKELARLISTTHHQFQFIHPFADTNGRTGRVLDHYIIWGPFELSGSTFDASPILDHFETDASTNGYYEGLQEADAGYMTTLDNFYEERIEAAVANIEASS